MEKNLIYIAEDNELMREVAHEILKSSFPNYHIETLENGHALEKALLKNTQNIALVLTDNIMPEKNGLEIIGEYSKKYPEIPFILMSAEYIETEALDAGAREFLYKPFNINDLETKLKKHLNQY